jgi:hypothetical protein
LPTSRTNDDSVVYEHDKHSYDDYKHCDDERHDDDHAADCHDDAANEHRDNPGQHNAPGTCQHRRAWRINNDNRGDSATRDDDGIRRGFRVGRTGDEA